jgi:hypothetical protein
VTVNQNIINKNMRKISNEIGNVLKERYKSYANQPEHKIFDACSFICWCEVETKYDYKFYRWLFADDTIEDYGKNLSQEEILLAKNFFECLENDSVIA